MTTDTATELTGILSLKYTRTIGGTDIRHWINERLSEMPDRAHVRLSFEVLDPHPPESEPKPVDCEKCEDRRYYRWHDPSGDGHGGLNGGAWVNSYCPECNPDGKYVRFPFIGR